MKREYLTRRGMPVFADVSEDAFIEPAKTRQLAKQKESHRIKQANRQILFWDGEGAKVPGKRKPQSYVLFGYYDGVRHDSLTGENLATQDMLRFILDTGASHPNGLHVSFAFGYDVDQILQNLSSTSLEFLAKRGYAKVGQNYRVEHIPGKWFMVTEYLGKKSDKDRKARRSVKIFDLWGFFQSSLVKALYANIPTHPLMARMPEIEAGKARRNDFTYADIEFITKYWEIENEMAHALATDLRERVFAAGFRISSWHGPASLASFAYQTNGVYNHKNETGPEIYDASRFAYAGGRIERFKIGRFQDVYGYDINSAYPNAIARLPSLSEGVWLHVPEPKRFSEFGVYRVEMRGPAIKRDAAPLFHRDGTGNITFPWRLSGWYWSPELRAMSDCMPNFQNIRILEGYEYVGFKTRPFAWIHDMYNERREMKRDGIGAQMALKLCMNSAYGKMAQRAGWERTGKAPRWHQLEWAGWVTSYTRAMLYRKIHHMDWSQLIAVETDGLYTTATPAEMGIKESVELGGWEVSHFDEMVYLQSGLYAKREGDDWSLKYRGLDKDSVSVESVIEHCRLLHANAEWPNLTGYTTRFVGYRNAIWREKQNRGPMKMHHRVWETDKKELSIGGIGKRIHSSKICNACHAGADAYEMPHETIIKSRSMLGGGDDELQSRKHDIPWLDNPDEKRYQWRDHAESLEGLLLE